MPDAVEEPPARVKLWDLPVRVIHWSFVLLMPALWWTWKSGDMELHRKLGYTMLALLVFRVFWGFFGGSTARFAGFVKGPASAWRYVSQMFSKHAEPIVGHNPLGGWSVIALLGLLIAQVGFGLFTQDMDALESGPLSYLVSYEAAENARYWHGFIFDVLLYIIGVHIFAVLFHLIVRRDNLIGPMITGSKRWKHGDVPAPAHVHWWRILIGAALAGGIAYWVSLGCPLPWGVA